MKGALRTTSERTFKEAFMHRDTHAQTYANAESTRHADLDKYTYKPHAHTFMCKFSACKYTQTQTHRHTDTHTHAHKHASPRTHVNTCAQAPDSYTRGARTYQAQTHGHTRAFDKAAGTACANLPCPAFQSLQTQLWTFRMRHDAWRTCSSFWSMRCCTPFRRR